MTGAPLATYFGWYSVLRGEIIKVKLVNILIIRRIRSLNIIGFMVCFFGWQWLWNILIKITGAR